MSNPSRQVPYVCRDCGHMKMVTEIITGLNTFIVGGSANWCDKCGDGLPVRQERDAGDTYGMLCGKPDGVVPGPVHARSAAEWPAFEDVARPWLETAYARREPHNVRAERPQTAGDKT